MAIQPIATFMNINSSKLTKLSTFITNEITQKFKWFCLIYSIHCQDKLKILNVKH